MSNQTEVSQELLSYINGFNSKMSVFIDRKGRFLIKIECTLDKLDFSKSNEIDYGRFKFQTMNFDSTHLKKFLIDFNNKSDEYFPRDQRNIDGILKWDPSDPRDDWDRRKMNLIFPGESEKDFNLSFDYPTRVIYYGVNTINVDEDILLQKDKDFFPNSLNAFRYYMKLPLSEFLSGILFILPLDKNYFEEVVISNKTIDFKLHRPSKSINNDFKICIYYSKTGLSESVTIPFKKSYTLKFKPDFFDLVLVDKDHNILDRRRWENKEGFEKHLFGVSYRYSKTEIDELLEQGETPKVEFKGFSNLLNLNDCNKKDIIETVTSFANSNGGSIFFGVVEKNKEWRITNGFTDTRPLHDVREQIKNLISAHCNPYVNFYCLFTNYENTKILVIEIPEGNRKPYEFNFVRLGEKKYFIRKESSDEQATREELITLCNAT